MNDTVDDTNDICENSHGGNAMSIAAFAQCSHNYAAERDLIEEYVKSKGTRGATCNEAEKELKEIFGQEKSLSPRFTELKLDGRIVMTTTGETRLTTLGCQAAVYVVPIMPNAQPVCPAPKKRTGRKRFFLSQDGDCHWYLVPEECREEWGYWLETDSEDAPSYAKALGGGPGRVTFTDPREDVARDCIIKA